MEAEAFVQTFMIVFDPQQPGNEKGVKSWSRVSVVFSMEGYAKDESIFFIKIIQDAGEELSASG